MLGKRLCVGSLATVWGSGILFSVHWLHTVMRATAASARLFISVLPLLETATLVAVPPCASWSLQGVFSYCYYDFDFFDTGSLYELKSS